MENTKTIYQNLLRKKVQRFNVEAYLNWLDSTDFYTAPAALRGPLARDGALVERVILFTNLLLDMIDEIAEETLVLVGMLAGLTRINTCEKQADGTYRLVKRPDVPEIGKCERGLLYGMQFFLLSAEEQMALRWFDEEMLREQQFDALTAYAEEKYPDDEELKKLIKGQKATALIAAQMCAQAHPIVRFAQGAWGMSVDLEKGKDFIHE